MSLLNVDNLSIRYRGKAVVDDLSFAVNRSECVGLVGESGSGKSQTAMALLGLSPADARVTGSIRFDGAEIVNAAETVLDQFRAKRIGMVFQDPMQALNPYLTLGEQFRHVVLRHGVATGAAATTIVIEMFERVGLPDAERQFHSFPHQLSGGMRQRAMIASALVAGPELLIADEPTTALDVTVQAQILDLLEALRDDTALLLITHDLGIVASRCERLLVLDAGRLVETGATASVFSAPKTSHMTAMLAAAPRIDSGEIPAPVDGKTVLVVENATVSHRDKSNTELHAVIDVTASLLEGETLALVGESGSGKSSLVRSLLGLIPMRAGRVVYAGAVLDGAVKSRAAAQRRDLQMVFQDPGNALNPQMRVDAIVGEPLRVHEPGQSSDARQQNVLTVLTKVGLDESFLRRYPHQLSGGQAQRVAIARALILKPRVLICDEAVAALDGSARQQVLDVLKTAQQDTGLSILFISHDLAVVRSLCHRVAVMYGGRLVEISETRQLYSRPYHPYTAALQDASPVPDPLAARASTPLPGEVPSPMSPAAGCAFHPRCPYAESRCSDERPLLRDVGGSHAACHLAEKLTLRRE